MMHYCFRVTVLLILLLAVLVSTVSTDQHHYHQCVHRFAGGISKLIGESSMNIAALFNKSQSLHFRANGGFNLFHIGPRGSNGDFELTLNQLNVTYFNNQSMSTHCSSERSTDFRFDSSITYHRSIADLTLLEHLVNDESTLFVLSDIDISNYLKEQESTTDCMKEKGLSCISLLPLNDSAPGSINAIIAESIWRQTKEAIECMIPSQRLLVLNNSLTGNSERYWTTLVAFLRLSKDDVPTRTLTSLIKAGVPELRNGRSCYMNDHVCMYSKLSSGKSVMVPSVCSLAENIDLVHANHPRVKSCATSYVNNLTTLFGERYRRVLLDKLLKPVVMTMYDTQADIILNIGPGSTGTRSLHMAMRQLNVTASHYRMSSKNCECLLAKEGSFVFEGKQLTLDPIRVFWGDTPMVQRWWWCYNYYPLSQTRFIMTDADEQKWLSVRLRDHCQSRRIDFDNGCFLPIPMSYFLYNSYHYDSKALSMIKDLAQLTHLTKVNNTMSVLGFQYYRDLLHCVIEPDRLLWLDMAKSNDSHVFWNNLVNFLQLKVAPRKLEQLINAGVPYVGTKGCVINKKPCEYASFKDKILPNGKLTSAVIPSVCVD